MGKRIPLDFTYRPKGQSHGTPIRDIPQRPPETVTRPAASHGGDHQKAKDTDEIATAILARKRALKAAQMRRYRANLKVTK